MNGNAITSRTKAQQILEGPVARSKKSQGVIRIILTEQEAGSIQNKLIETLRLVAGYREFLSRMVVVGERLLAACNDCLELSESSDEPVVKSDECLPVPTMSP